RSGQIVTIEHAGLQFSERTSAGGTLSISFPAMSEISFITATFEDGAQGEASLSVRDAGKVERMAIVWSAPVELDLHAYEGGGARSDGNHVWEGAPRSYRETLTRGGGYLVTYGDPEIIGGSRTEVYSLPTTRVRATVTVNMDLNVGDASQICDDDIGLKTVRTQKGRDVEVRSFNLRMPGCSVASAGMVLENFTDALEVSRR
ncbi:MAG TPA: hypothetical protein VLA51_09745, partial [Paracoccaceae bacterium]|nr:hypothetical protein [Paracoccaceae bacterium]